MPKRSSKTLIYAPEVTIYIATQNNGVIDVSDDIVQGQVRRIVNGVSQASFVLNNRDHKYMGVLGRMDRIVIFMKRIKNIQVFAGYLDSVPAVALYTNTVNVRASCTLKLLQNTFWDQGLPESQLLLTQTAYTDVSDSGGPGAATDSGMGQMMATVLQKVGGWKRDSIIIQNIPSAFMNIIADADAAAQNAQYVENLKKLLGFSTTTAGTVPDSASTTTKTPTVNKPSNGKTYSLADLVTIAKAVGFLGDSATTAAAISYAATKGNPSYISSGVDGAAGLWGISKVDEPNVVRKDALDPIKGGKLYYTITKNGKDFSKSASFANGSYKSYLAQARAAAAKPDTNAITYSTSTAATTKADSLTEPRIDFLNDQNTVPKYTDSTPIETLKGIYGSSAEEVKSQLATILFQGQSIQVHKKAANAFRAVDSAITAANLGYKINTISTFDWRPKNNGSGTSELSFHSFGIAVDINEATNGFANAGVGPDSTDFPAGFINAFKKNGFEWGGDWSGGKDYMHFQWMGGGSFSATENTPGTESSSGTTNGDLGSLFESGVFKYLYMGKDLDPLSLGLQGEKAPINDVSLLSTIQGICSASLRSFMSAPDGSFVAFYPDYFGTMGSKTKMIIEDIELLDFGIDMNDDNLVTDLFVTGANYSQYDGTGVSINRWYASAGVMNIRDEGAIKLLLGIDPSDDADFNPDNIYAKFGLRPLKMEFPNAWSGAFEKAQALYAFQKKWAEQYSTRVSFTFMPELYPGMRILIKSHGVEVFVEEVTHSFGYDTGFTTIATVSSPATVGGGIKGMPLGRL